MKIIKRNGSEIDFDISKIQIAISKANAEVIEQNRLTEQEIIDISENIKTTCENLGYIPNVEEIQDFVEKCIMKHQKYDVAKRYMIYRYTRSLVRESSPIDDKILSLIEYKNEEVKQENSNKNPIINSVQRDYMAGEVSRDITKRFLLPNDIVDAHEKGIIHFHDTDYYSQHMHNCFHEDTEILTKTGTKTFKELNNGDVIKVLDMDGKWREATVKQYEDQPMHIVSLKEVHGTETKEVICTKDHRWILSDGTVVTLVHPGMLLKGQFGAVWLISDIKPYENDTPQKTWCVEEPVTHSFTLDGGIVTGNCCLINLEDMFQNGTAISGTMIETPKSFSTACNIATQIIAQVASSQYGGQTITLSHLAPFVDVSRQKYRKIVREELEAAGIPMAEYEINTIAELRVREEIKRGVQIIQYQIITLMTTNGQAPFVTVFMYLNEVEEGRTRDDLAMIIEEMLNQRILGVKNKKGVYITPAFPKLIYTLQKDNITSDGKYWYLTKLAATCTAKRMVPDYISEKKMLELKVDMNGNGNCYPCMGCVDGRSVIDYKIGNVRYVESFERAWNRLSQIYTSKIQPNGKDMYIDTPDVSIWDTKEQRYVKQYRIIRNTQSDWRNIVFSNGRTIDVTNDHPFEIIDKGVVHAENLQIGDRLLCDYTVTVSREDINIGITTCCVNSIEQYDETKYSYDVTTETEHFSVNNIYSHNCRSFLTPYVDEDGKPKYYGRFNQGVVTINLVDVACSSEGNMDKFWEIFDERLELCYKALMCRHKRLLGTPSDVAPVLWQDGALARLKKGEPIDKLLFGGYSTISLGYAGLYECTYYMTGKSHTADGGKEFALSVMQHLNDACKKWKEQENIDFSIYGTPLESTTYKFARCLQKRFGKIPGVTDRNYITNSYHIHVTEEIDAFSKLSFESEFQQLSPGGAISYIETPNMMNNIDAVLAVMQHIYENIMYAELNTKSDYCQKCGYDGEIIISEDDGKLIWECPNCGNKDQSTMNVARRTCGYIGTQYWNQGRTQEIRDRVTHL